LNKVKAEKKTVFTANNGVLEIKSSPEFAPSVFSLTYKGREWLATDYPERTNRSWWNSWFGGITSKPSELKEHHWVAEKTKAAFVKKSDSLGNLWEGIKLTTTVEKFDAMKGVTVNQYFMMMPNQPVLVFYVEVANNSGFMKEYTYAAGDTFINYDGDLKNIESKVITDNREITIKCGHESAETTFDSNLYQYKNRKRTENYFYYNANPKSGGNSYSDTSSISTCFVETSKIKNGERKVFPPKFIIFSDIELKEENLADLQNVRF
jgi:hypothetical protein